MDLEYRRRKKKKMPGYLSVLVVACMVFFNTTLAASADTKLETVYHVYMDDTYLGKVSDTTVVESAVSGIIDEQLKEYSGYQLELDNKISYIPEQVFRINEENDLVIKELKNHARVKANAIAITVNDKPLIYLKSREDAEKAIEDLKRKYVSKKEWNDFKGQQINKESLPSLQADQSRVINISIKEDMEYKQMSVNPDEVTADKDAVNLLQKGTLEEKKHIIKAGEALESIAPKYNLTTKELMELNKGITEDSILQIGQELNTVVTVPLLRVVVEREAYQEEVVQYEKEVIENGSMPKGETKVKQEGKNGKSGFLYSVIEENGNQVKKETKEETIIDNPVKEIVEKGTKVIPSRGTGQFAWPANGGYISSGVGQRWGSLHKGIDIARPSNYTIKAADNGVVVSAGWNGGYGNKIVIDHQNGYRTVYAHLKTINVSVGQKVEKGSAIGIMGSTGNSTGIHLHFEVYKNGSLKNPKDYF
ncbi:M23 family metallopeptidase [Bacillus niameyensis]|uniref:M23 family metallopeptidase n=1 Tax=Bacillus niameyensis TaxID=1522308 RepID=UPI0007845D34|nr:M23 family metallopeptidase [Bacillus niameyensis]